ncbi:MAG: hypothetical protein CV087_00170 [Candidatus Brocadia sp. WS118]|nr:MAG: hypothetical protein CV087_00170 [Candidatus Brocadia sp. WS118]
MIEEEILTILEKKERKRFFHQIQNQAEEEGHVPPTSFLFLKKMSHPLQYMGGILFGIFLGVFILVFNYLFFVFLLHLQF